MPDSNGAGPAISKGLNPIYWRLRCDCCHWITRSRANGLRHLSGDNEVERGSSLEIETGSTNLSDAAQHWRLLNSKILSHKQVHIFRQRIRDVSKGHRTSVERGNPKSFQEQNQRSESQDVGSTAIKIIMISKSMCANRLEITVPVGWALNTNN